MSRAGDPLMPDTAAAATADDAENTLRLRYLMLLLAALVAAVLILHDSYASMLEIWLRSETYHHGLIIYPLSAYLIWRRWPTLRVLPLRPFFPGVAALAATSGLWWLCGALGIQVGQHFSAVAAIPLLVLTIAGARFAGTIAFPLGYLVFAVPFGEFLIPHLIDFTAYFTVEALQLSGFPVIRDGVFFSIPAGDFEVAKACSGIRYLLASLALGTLYGYLIFRSMAKRVAFFLFALALPIFANGLRAFGIVLLAHYSEMRIAVGVDHLVYGWIFFGLIMLLMFWIGGRFSDRMPTERLGDAGRLPRAGSPHASQRLMLLGVLLSLAALSAGPVLAVAGSVPQAALPPPGLPAAIGDFEAGGGPPPDWQPAFRGATHELTRSYAAGEQRIALAVIRYDATGQGTELANRANLVADMDLWDIVDARLRSLSIDGEQVVNVRESVIRRAGMTRLVWSWSEVDGEQVDGALSIKWRETAAFLRGRRPASAAFVASIRVAGRDPQQGAAALAGFVADAWSELRRCAYNAGAEAQGCVFAGTATPAESR